MLGEIYILYSPFIRNVKTISSFLWICTPYFTPYFTRFNRGFALFAAGLALRVALARIAPACFIDTPSLRAIDF